LAVVEWIVWASNSARWISSFWTWIPPRIAAGSDQAGGIEERHGPQIQDATADDVLADDSSGWRTLSIAASEAPRDHALPSGAAPVAPTTSSLEFFSFSGL